MEYEKKEERMELTQSVREVVSDQNPQNDERMNETPQNTLTEQFVKEPDIRESESLPPYEPSRKTLALDKRLKPSLETSSIPSREEFPHYYQAVEKLLGVEKIREHIKATYPDPLEQAQKLEELEDQVKATAIMMLAADARKHGEDLSHDPFVAKSRELMEEDREDLLHGFRTEAALRAYERFMASVAAFDPITGEGYKELEQAMDDIDMHIYDMPWEAVLSILFANLRLILLLIATHPKEILEMITNGKATEIIIQGIASGRKGYHAALEEQDKDKKVHITEETMLVSMLERVQNQEAVIYETLPPSGVLYEATDTQAQVM